MGLVFVNGIFMSSVIDNRDASFESAYELRYIMDMFSLALYITLSVLRKMNNPINLKILSILELKFMEIDFTYIQATFEKTKDSK